MAVETTGPDSEVADESAADAAAIARPPGTLRRLLRDPLSATGLVIVTVLVMAAVLAPWLAPHDPSAVDAVNRLDGHSALHPLGTDELGRDVLSRLLFGARWSLGIAVLATGVVMLIGTVIGTVSGYYGGLVDTLVMRVVDVLLALPNLVLYLAIVGTLGSGIRNVFIALVSISWASYARVVRGLVLASRERDYVRASLALGASDRRLMLRHILPNVISPVAILGSLQAGGVILALAALGFFGLGAQPPTPEWGTMINQATLFVQTAPTLIIYPGIAIALAILGCNLLGDGLRDILDPRLAERR